MFKKLLLFWFLPLFAFLTVTTTVNAGYTYSDGYWWSGGVAYTRTTSYTWVPQYDYTYCVWRGYWEPNYTYSPVQVNPNSPNVKELLVGLAVSRAKAQDKVALKAQEHQQTVELVKLLGLEGNFTYMGYYGNTSFPNFGIGNGNYQLSSAGAQGNTVYGYSYSQTVDAYGTTDMNALYQQASRLVDGAQKYTADAHKDFSGLVGQTAEAQRAIAEINAKGTAAVRVLEGLKPSSQVKVETKINGNAISPTGPTNPTGPISPLVVNPVPNTGPIGPISPLMSKAGPLTCINCHNSSVQSGKFDFSQYNPETASWDTKKVIIKYVRSTDPDHSCPKGGPKISGDQLDRLLNGPLTPEDKQVKVAPVQGGK